MADYWKSQGRKFCDFCKCWLADNKPSIEFHENGKKHKENVEKRLKEIRKNSVKQAKQQQKFDDDIKKMENAAMAAYLKDVENDQKDLTAENIIRQKSQRSESMKDQPSENPNQMPSASAETNPRFQNITDRNFSQDMDPCEPLGKKKQKPPSHPKGNSKGGGQNKQGKKKPNSKETLEGKKVVTKQWYEAQNPEGYSYYWHVETNETSWEVPEEGFMSIAEQAEEAKEQKIQEELLNQLEKEEAEERADILEEQRANAERERLKEMKKVREEKKEEIEEIPYRRDYSVPQKPQPYGTWQTVKVVEKKSVDLQLPKRKEALVVPTLQNEQLPPSQRVFKEKTVDRITVGSDDEDEAPSTFKKRKFGQKNVRKRFED